MSDHHTNKENHAKATKRRTTVTPEDVERYRMTPAKRKWRQRVVQQTMAFTPPEVRAQREINVAEVMKCLRIVGNEMLWE